jgi:hypothetical protein
MARNFALFLLGLVIAFGLSVFTQGQTPSQTEVQPWEQAPGEYQVLDGGTRQQFRSIAVPPMVNAPFTATLHTEWVRGAAEAGTMTVVNDRRIARDGSGRIYQERWLLVPKNGEQKSELNAIQISDPEKHTLYTCWMRGAKECDLLVYTPAAGTVFKPQVNATGALPDEGYRVREELGHQTILGVDTAGAKEITTFPPGVHGNDQKLVVTREYWYSTQLGIDPLSKRSDPRFGTQTFTLTNLNLGEPDSKLFELPEGFPIVDKRKTVSPAAN